MMQCNTYCVFVYVGIYISYTCAENHQKVIADLVCFRPCFEMDFEGAAYWAIHPVWRVLCCQMIVAFTDNTN